MKRTAAALLVSVVLFSAASAAWALNIPKPTAEITRFQLDSITLRDVTFLFDLAVKNPYPVSLSFKGMTLNFTVEGAKVFSASSQGGFTVKANKQRTNTFTVTLAYDAVIKLIKNYVSKEWLDTVIDGTLVIPLPKIPGLPLPDDITFKYKLSKKIPAIKPNVGILNFKVSPPTAEQVRAALIKEGKKTDPKKALGVFKDVLAGRKPAAPVIDPAELDVPLTVSFTLSIKNEAKGPLSFNGLDYELFVNGERLVKGQATSIVREAEKSLVTVTNVFSSKQLSKNVKELFSSRKGRFGVKGSASIKLPDEIRKDPIPLSFDESGHFSIAP